LVPLDFRYLPFDQAWAAFKQTPFLQLGVESRADWVANGVLYVPVGFLGVRALAAPRLGLLPFFALATACLLAFVVEFTQLYFPPRTVSQNDLLAECIGSLLGVLGAVGLGPWLARWWQAWALDPARLARLASQAYALAYLLYCFFPFDVLVSQQEFADKMASSSGWGWLFAATGDSVVWLRAAVLLVVETVLTIPIGLALTMGRTRAMALRRGLFVGAMLGLVIEFGQLFIASGVSQGASVASRAVAVGLGAWIISDWQHHNLEAARSWLSRNLRWLFLAYLMPLGYGSGWGTHAWGGWDRALQSWGDLRFLPFYYHYFVTEATALKSLGSVVVLYAPLAVLLWARMAGAAGAAVSAASIAAVFELGKLFLAGIHPDPTNVLLAGVSVWLLVKALGALLRLGRRVARNEVRAPLPLDVPVPASAPKQEKRHLREFQFNRTDAIHTLLDPRSAWVWAVLLPVMWAALNWPIYAWLVVGVVAAAGLATWWRPALVLVIIPLAMPAFDLSAWSGRFFFDEFDLLCATCLAIGVARVRPRLFGVSRPILQTIVFAAFGATLCISALLPLLGGWSLDMNSFSHYHSLFNGLRIAKGALWAWLFLGLYGALVKARPELARWFHAGIAAGLMLTVIVILWERLAFVSLLDFSTAYRVTGPFSVMNKGGAYIECFLAVAAAIVAVEVLTCRSRIVFWAGSALLVLASYAVFVTYSRNGYAALVGGLAVALIAGWRMRRRHVSAVLALLLVVGLVGGTGALVLGGSFARERLDASAHDLQTRWAHWRAALDLRDGKLSTQLFGVGLGRFPYKHYWSSIGEPRAAGFTLEPSAGNTFLRLGTGATVYIEQLVTPPAGKELDLTMNVRSATGAPKLSVTLCRKSMLTSEDCEQVLVEGIKAPGRWQTQYATIPPLPAPRNAMAALVPIKLSIATPAAGPAIDVDNVSLRPAGTGNYLVRNGSFANGMDRWFFATDVDPPWHIHSLPVALLFDLGWVGLAAAVAVLALALAGGGNALLRGNVAGIAAFAGLVAFLVSGSVNTLIDEPRFLWLLGVLTWLCARHRRSYSPDGAVN
jgi:glycopeptide antibiotics resistance protein